MIVKLIILDAQMVFFFKSSKFNEKLKFAQNVEINNVVLDVFKTRWTQKLRKNYHATFPEFEEIL